ncbi:MAG: recombination mediator RecR [Verrucomicrobiota bacterium]|nr:recombination mediator RecR [Limisphaera sp.]MDW8380719.1 recombination mediator RecR [Verrucomicrobiota bacterium]
MPEWPESIKLLIAALMRLPGVGRRSAERMALFLVESEPEIARGLAAAIERARTAVRACERCGSLTEDSPCVFCTDPRRDDSLLCVVERPKDVLSLERSGSYRGRYHVLGGRLSPLEGVEVEDLRIQELERRLREEPVQEVILALGTDVEGEATSHYLAKRLARPGLRITRIAHGLPAGTGLEYADELTLGHALQGRREIT